MLFTIGHSNHPIDAFITLLQRHGVTAVGDVRSHPYSRYAPQYCRDPLKAALARKGIAYVFLGRELGARSKNPDCYKHGKVQFDRFAGQPQFAEGIRRVTKGMEQHCVESSHLQSQSQSPRRRESRGAAYKCMGMGEYPVNLVALFQVI